MPRVGSSLQDLGVINDGAILVRDGLIHEVGPSRRVENLAESRDALEVNAAGRVVMPGFVDAHTHLVFPPAGVHRHDPRAAIGALRAATGQRLELRARAFIDSMARHGTTTVEVKTGCGPDDSGEAKLLRVLSAVRNDPLDVVASFLFRLPRSANGESLGPPAWTANDLLSRIKRRRWARFADLDWDPDPDLLPRFEAYLTAARAHGFTCRIHAGGPGLDSAIALALRHGVSGIDHLEHANESHARQLAAAGIVTTLLPGVLFHNDELAPPARTLIDAGGVIALGSNFNPHHAPMLNMQIVVALACWRLRMSLEEAICASTINGAYALGCASRTGSLEIGKSADLIVLNAGDYRDLANNIGTNLVHLTMKRGNFIYKEGEVASRTPQITSPET